MGRAFLAGVVLVVAGIAFAGPPGWVGIDADGDGYLRATDCDDSDASVHRDAPELCTDAIDSDCTGHPSNGCDVRSLEDVGVYYEGENAYTSLGWTVANAGDVDG